MADSKYAGLPGIAYDQPDVYETTDLPEADQKSDFFEDEKDPVERLHISTKEAFDVFKDKHLDSRGIDFSDKISRRVRTGYDARSGDWELVAQGTKETPLQKYQRLQCEMKELMEEVSQAKPEEQTGLTSAQVDQALKQLYDLKLEDMLGADLSESLNDPQSAHTKKLLMQLEQFKQTATSDKQKPESDDAIVYELKYRPEHNRLAQTSRLAELELRLNRLENVLGTKSENLSRLTAATQQNTLYDAVQKLSSTASLLNSAQLDHIEGRLTALQQKMNELADCKKKKDDATSEIGNEKINELYESIKKMDNFSQVLPETIDRLVALESLHNQVVEFNKSMEQLKMVHSQITGDVQNNKELLQAVQESFALNLDNVNKGITSLNGRIESLKKPKK